MKRIPQNDMPNRTHLFGRWVGRSGQTTAVVLATALAAATSSAQVVLDGGEYKPIGTLTGDQSQPSLALKSAGGLLVWSDNTDGDGAGIRARLLGSQATGLMEAFRVNQSTVADQEGASVATFADGSYLIVWQSGRPGTQQIMGRRLSSAGIFLGDEFVVSAPGANRGARLTPVSATEMAVAWTARSAVADMDDAFVAVVNAAGEMVKGPQVVNLTRSQNQRDVAVAATGNGTFLVAYVSETVATEVTTRVLGRIFGKDGTPTSSELLISPKGSPAASPSVVALGSGWVVAWSQLNLKDLDQGWDIAAVRLEANGVVAGGSAVVNERTLGSQINPKLSAFGDSVAVVYESAGIDGFGIGVGARVLNTKAAAVGAEFPVNTGSVGDQIQPTVSGVGDRLVVVWSSFNGLSNGMDLRAQRLALPVAPLVAPSAPYLTALSSGRLLVAWAQLDGLALKGYEVTVDGGVNVVPASEGVLVLSGLAPASQHVVSLAYVLADGRRSPESVAVAGRTWAEDSNADGVPDDWQSLHFGANPQSWPEVGADSDGDGRSNRDEFLSGTSPVDKESVLAIRISDTAQGRMLQWNTLTGAVYQVQSSNDLKDWQDLGGRRLATGSQDAIIVGAGQASSYFRINFHR